MRLITATNRDSYINGKWTAFI